MPEDGFGRYNKFEWLNWITRMRTEHGESHGQGARVRGVGVQRAIEEAKEEEEAKEIDQMLDDSLQVCFSTRL